MTEPRPLSNCVRIRLHPRGQTIEVPRGTSLREVLFPVGVEFPCGGEGYCRGCRVRVIEGELAIDDVQRNNLTLADIASGWRLGCRCRVQGDVTLEVAQWADTVLVDDSQFAFTPRKGYGIAVDVGTTTLAAQLLDLGTASVLAVQTALNPQGAHGSDIMSRVQFALSPEGAAKLRDSIRDTVRSMIMALCVEARLEPEVVRSVTLVGNTVMHHLFCGLDVTPLSVYPYESDHLGAQRYRGSDLGWTVDEAKVVFLPCIGGFVGSDVLAGVLATGLHEREALEVLVDLGTNGEIVVGNREGMLCASAAAGPAFEGARIQMGMRATTGAISEVRLSDGRLECSVIGGGTPRGICGSGLVDAAAAVVQLGWVKPMGKLADGRTEIELLAPVSLVQRDIRELQLAKGAIAAGLHLLLNQSKQTLDDVAVLHLAGAFGNYINRTSARRIGLLDCPEDKIRAAGNTALLGAKLALFLDLDEIEPVRQRIKHVQLASDPQFQDSYVDAMAFPA